MPAQPISKSDAQPSPNVLYPYLLLIALADVYFTARILDLGGSEINAFANQILQHAGVLGLLTLKLTSVLIVFLTCDYIARRGDRRALRLAQIGIAINIFPVVVGGSQLAAYLVRTGGLA